MLFECVKVENFGQFLTNLEPNICIFMYRQENISKTFKTNLVCEIFTKTYSYTNINKQVCIERQPMMCHS